MKLYFKKYFSEVRKFFFMILEKDLGIIKEENECSL